MAEHRPANQDTVPLIEAVLWQIKQSLDQLGFDIAHGKYPARLLKDVKLAVDDLRLKLWGVLESEGPGDAKFARLSSVRTRRLSEFRMKRVERMLTDLRMDLTKGAMSRNDTELKALTASLQATIHSITRATQKKV